MAPDVRSSTGGTSFDFNSQAGVLAVLGAIRASELNTSDRNELRDLVFLYSNGGGDAAVRTVLEERLRAAGITLVPTPVKKSEAEVIVTPVRGAGFSTGRPVPVFSPGTPVVLQPVKAPLVLPPTPLPVTIPVPVVALRPVVMVPRPVVSVSPAPVVVQAPVPAVRVTPVIPVIPLPVSEMVSPVTVFPIVPVIEPVNPAATLRLERIRHIKSEVNGRVGNPVNLVDLDNALGREYMSALLEAMKLIADANETDAATAMSRLESVYAKVLTLLDQPKAPTAVVAVNPVVPTVSIPVPLVTPVPVNSDQVSWGESLPVPATPTVIPVRIMPTLSGVPVPVTSVALPNPVTHMPIRSVRASQTPLRSITELPTADEVNSKNAHGDPLFTGEVDTGLQQLLSEWSLFKKSGLFGTGPGGRQHPLFLKIAPLPLPLLLAGRFEGSTPDIKQSVTDYMNGWRYEQGIVYEKDETFEHYLRRVIRHIIDLQIAKRSA